MKITDLRCATIGRHPVVRILTDTGIDGLGPVEHFKPAIKPYVLLLKDALIGEDPTNVERVMLRIRQRGAFKPFGAAVSAVEIALWDIAGKAVGLPVHKLLGGKVRDRVRVYNGAIRERMTSFEPEDFADSVRKMKAAPHGFTIVKQGIGFHSGMKDAMPNFHYGEKRTGAWHGWIERGPMTERGLRRIVDCVAAMKEVLGDEIGLALDCGPGMMPADALRLAKAVERFNLMWLEDMISGDYTPFVNADVYRDITHATSTPIHTGEQIYLRQNCKSLIESHAVNVIGPDPCDVGGIAELKWIAEYADLHGILMAPHGTGDGPIGLAALVQVCATLPDNYIAFELPGPDPAWDGALLGLPDPIAQDGFISVWDTPGLGVRFDPEKARGLLREEDRHFFD
ncbi:MAG: mandelate racemase/muconate lactonizing enzyme family protein [Acetobacteraceae bacterium]|nr:mandelate racemase/muconate lactonizing enzyme family protein [Acetobacteraceae bacterium]